jgi:hypothetical protein
LFQKSNSNKLVKLCLRRFGYDTNAAANTLVELPLGLQFLLPCFKSHRAEDVDVDEIFKNIKTDAKIWIDEELRASDFQFLRPQDPFMQKHFKGMQPECGLFEYGLSKNLFSQSSHFYCLRGYNLG